MGVNSTNESGKPKNQKQKSHSRKLLRRNLSSNRPSCKNDAAKIQINHKAAIQKLTEYEYTGKELRKVDNALALIIRSIIGFLETGVYEDLTGVAVRHHSPA